MRGLLVFLAGSISLSSATLGKVVPLVGGASDLVLDQTRNLIYLPSSVENTLNIYSVAQQTFLTAIPTDQTPLSAALSRDGNSLFVACYNSAVLDVINLTTMTVQSRVTLPARPEGVAVGSDGRALISTAGSGTTATANLLLIYDPSPSAAVSLSALSVTPPAPAAPTFPPPSGRPFLSAHSRLVATRDGTLIAGVNVPATGSATVYVYQAASDTLLLSRTLAGSSTAIAISDDGTRIFSGVNLFDSSTLRVLAQQNLANSPYPIPPSTSFTTQANQGGAVFAPNGQTLYAAYNVAPVQSPAAASNVTQMMLNDPDSLLINMGIQLPDNLDGRMVISSDGNNIYALSDSGFVILPVGTISTSPLAVPSAAVTLLTYDPCGITASTSIATITINNPGQGRITATAQQLTYTGVTNQASPVTAPTVRASSGSSPQFVFSFNSSAQRNIGTISPPHDFLIQSQEAVNIPNRVRMYQNSRASDARGTILPIPLGISDSYGLMDLAYDSTRQRVYIANAGRNEVEVYDIASQALLTPVKVGQLPVSLALTPDGDTLYVANSGGESVSIIDPNALQVIGTAVWPPLAFDSSTAMVTPSVIAAGLSGLQILMSDGSLWRLVGSDLSPRGVSVVLGQTAQGAPVKLPLPSSMAATADGSYILLATNNNASTGGFVYLYDGTVDDWVVARQLFTASSASGFLGPVAAGPNGAYFVANGYLMNSELVAVAPVYTGLIAGLAPAGTGSYAVFSPPATPSAGTVTVAPSIEILNASNGNTSATVSALEGPFTQVTATGKANINGRTMAVDSSRTNSYLLTESGLSIIPLAAPTASQLPQVNKGGAVNLASYQLPVASNGLLTIFGQNLGSSATAAATPLPVVLGGSCVTLNNVALPLFMTSPTQINAQIPPSITAGSYPLVVQSVANQAGSASQTLAVSKYGPAVLVDSTGQIALFHADGSYVNKNNPATRDEPLTMYAVGLGPTTGGAVVGGEPSPSSPLAVTGTVSVYFGDPSYSQAAVIVDWSGLTPSLIGVYQLNLRIPGTHLDGDALPVTVRVGGVSSPTSGPVVPQVAVN